MKKTLRSGLVVILSVIFAAECEFPPPTSLPSTGSLQITVNGLPNGLSADISVGGPNAYAQTLTSSRTIRWLAPGTYAVTAQNVISGSTTYIAAVSGSPAAVTGGGTAQISVTYSSSPSATGWLQITVSGLPSGTSAGMTITGPGGPVSYSDVISDTYTFGALTPGNYTVDAQNVTSGGTTYSATVSGSPATVSEGSTAQVSVVYSSSPPTTGHLLVTVNGLPGGTSADVLVSGPNGYAQPLTGSQTLGALMPGSYSVSAQNVTSGGTTYSATVGGSPATVVAGSTAQVNVTYSPSGPSPTVNSFTATASTITQGDSVTLSWQTANATSVSISGIGGVALSGTWNVSPTSTTTYILNATNSMGTSTVTYTITVVPQPVINSFTGSPNPVTKGNSSTLSWQTTNATNVSIGGIGYVLQSGSASVAPNSTTTYTLTATNSVGRSTTASVTITVQYLLTVQAQVGRGAVNINGGPWAQTSTLLVNSGSGATINALRRDGYAFMGWNCTAGNPSIADTGALSTTVNLPSGPATILAVFATGQIDALLYNGNGSSYLSGFVGAYDGLGNIVAGIGPADMVSGMYSLAPITPNQSFYVVGYSGQYATNQVNPGYSTAFGEVWNITGGVSVNPSKATTTYVTRNLPYASNVTFTSSSATVNIQNSSGSWLYVSVTLQIANYSGTVVSILRKGPLLCGPGTTSFEWSGSYYIPLGGYYLVQEVDTQMPAPFTGRTLITDSWKWLPISY